MSMKTQCLPITWGSHKSSLEEEMFPKTPKNLLMKNLSQSCAGCGEWGAGAIYTHP